jgi:hypothetical protein
MEDNELFEAVAELAAEFGNLTVIEATQQVLEMEAEENACCTTCQRKAIWLNRELLRLLSRYQCDFPEISAVERINHGGVSQVQWPRSSEDSYTIMKTAFPFLSVREVAVACDLSDANIYKHIELGHIEVIKRENFKNIMIPAASLAAFLRARAEGKFKRPAKRQDKLKAKPSARDQDETITLTVKG